MLLLQEHLQQEQLAQAALSISCTRHCAHKQGTLRKNRDPSKTTSFLLKAAEDEDSQAPGLESRYMAHRAQSSCWLLAPTASTSPGATSSNPWPHLTQTMTPCSGRFAAHCPPPCNASSSTVKSHYEHSTRSHQRQRHHDPRAVQERIGVPGQTRASFCIAHTNLQTAAALRHTASHKALCTTTAGQRHAQPRAQPAPRHRAQCTETGVAQPTPKANFHLVLQCVLPLLPAHRASHHFPLDSLEQGALPFPPDLEITRLLCWE